jgi:1,2-phenylacetyl-CoA epoxidase catalytic subunit
MIQTAQPTALQMDIPAATNTQQDCRQRYKIHKEDHEALRQAFHLEVSERRALQYGTSVETQQKITKNAFRTKQTYSRIRTVQQ